MHELIHQSDLIRFLRADVLAGENHVERRADTDESWQALRSAGAGNQAELNLGQRENCFWIVRRNPVSRRKRQLECTAEAGPVNRADEGSPHPFNGIE